MHTHEPDDDEEIAFWRGFIEWWAREKDRPVPPRAWEALARAELERADAASMQSGSQRFRRIL